MRKRRDRKRGSRFEEYQCDADPSSSGASSMHTAAAPSPAAVAAAAASAGEGNRASPKKHKPLTDDEYQEAAAAAMRNRKKQIGNVCQSRRAGGGFMALEPMPTPPAKAGAKRSDLSADALAPQEQDQQRQRHHQQQQQQPQQQQQQQPFVGTDELRAKECQRRLLHNSSAALALAKGTADTAAAAADAAAAAGPSMQQLGTAVKADLQPEAAVLPASQGGGLGLPGGSSQQHQHQQQQQDLQDWQELGQHMLQSQSEVNAAIETLRFEQNQQLVLEGLKLLHRQQSLELWQALCMLKSKQAMPASLQRLLSQQATLLEFAGELRVTAEQQQLKGLVLDRQQHMLENWQQLHGDVHEQQRLLCQQDRALQIAQAGSVFADDPFAFLRPNQPPQPKMVSHVDLMRGWTEVLRQDAEQQEQQQQQQQQQAAT